jgi:F0F1-type ATP synthase assembly protein I
MKFFVPAPRPDRAPKSLATGSSDSLGRGMDVALTLAVFLGLGWLLDRWLGTAPVFMIVLTVLAAVGQFLRMKYVYDAQMERLEAQRLEGRARRTGSAGPMEDAA